jgi:hypothetical protein
LVKSGFDVIITFQKKKTDAENEVAEIKVLG